MHIRLKPERHKERGAVAVMCVIAIVAILLVFVAGNARTLNSLGRDIRLIEKRQIQRLSSPQPRPAAATNSAVHPTASPLTSSNSQTWIG